MTKTKRNKKRSNVTPTEKFVQKYQDSYTSTDWVVFVPNGNRRNGAMIYPGHFTRDNVRNAYQNEFRVPIQSTRSRRIKNF